MKDIPYVQISRQFSSWSFALGILPLSGKKKNYSIGPHSSTLTSLGILILVFKIFNEFS